MVRKEAIAASDNYLDRRKKQIVSLRTFGFPTKNTIECFLDKSLESYVYINSLGTLI
jgi:hypothetical protein